MKCDNSFGRQYLQQVNISRHPRSIFNVTGLEDVAAELLLTMLLFSTLEATGPVPHI